MSGVRMKVSIDKISQLQRQTNKIRNICILAHVDHGKTTLADSLVASNGIISQRMSGKLRYLDSREDEQLRGITMKSSAISLLHQQGEDEYLINLIDSPGHIDFTSEVSTAVRLCDGAIVVIDVVEGVCPQTHAVLRQAWLEGIKPILLINKMDRLIVELKFTPMEAFTHLQQLLEQVNAITGELFTSDILEKDAAKPEVISSEDDQVHCLDDTDDSHLYFSPDQGNVIFTSAIDGWGFGIAQFAEMYSKKLGIKVELLKKTLWGDYYLSVKQKRILSGAQAKGKKPLFVQFVLENLWIVYNSILVERNKDLSEKIVNSLNLKIATRDSRHTDVKVYLQAVCCQWLPLSRAVLDAVCWKLPSPLDMTEERVKKLMGRITQSFDSLPQETQLLKEAFLKCSTEEESVIVFISKMFPVDKKSLPENRQRPLTQEELASRRELARRRHAERLQAKLTDDKTSQVDPVAEEQQTKEYLQVKVDGGQDEVEQTFVAFGRVFSGTVKKGRKLVVLGPKHDPLQAMKQISAGENFDAGLTLEDLDATHHVTTVSVEDLYLFMGRELEALDEVPAGNVLGIGGLEDHILKSATLSSTIACPAFSDMYFEASAIVRVALEPHHPGDMHKLVRGMKLLNQADPCVEVLVQETGEHVIVTAGEVHLQRCIDDLQLRYAKIKINVSDPIVPFRETIILPPKMDMVNENVHQQATSQSKTKFDDEDILQPGLVQMETPNKACRLRVRALPLPDSLEQLLERNGDVLKIMNTIQSSDNSDELLKINEDVLSHLSNLKDDIQRCFNKDKKYWRKVDTSEIWAFGPRRNGPNLLINKVPGYKRKSLWRCLDDNDPNTDEDNEVQAFDNSVVSGFQLATLSGPLCEEPMMGVGFIIEELDLKTHKIHETSDALENGDASDKLINESERVISYGPMSGQIMSCVKDCCRKAFQSQPQRLMAAMYSCVTQATADVLGKVYAVLSKRHGHVISEELRDGSSIFIIESTLPVIESFGFSEEIRNRTSGLASPQLKFSHYDIIDIDPFWEPTTEEEYTHYGEKADSHNQALKYMNNVRRRKGLHVHEKIVEHAEKQRTLTKNK